MNSLFSYFRNVRAELDHVVWPSPRTAVVHVIIIILISAVIALLIAGLDYVFTVLVSHVATGQ